ncbi:hypothetical protein ACTU44_01640 [Thalassospira sp. SM2505]
MKLSKSSWIQEIDELKSIISSIPEENVLERYSLEQRLAAAQKKLASEVDQLVPEKSKLTFRGAPVTGSKGIAAEFGSKATAAFTEAYAAVIAGMHNKLRYMGPIPDKIQNQLMITGTAIGSFGFELQVPKLEPTLFSDSGDAEEALEKLLSLFETSVADNDDQLAEIISEIHPRAIQKAASFLEYMIENGAWCGLQFKGKTFRFRNIEQLETSLSKIKEDNIHESTENYRGELQGVLPRGRTFEFNVIDQNIVIKGKVGSEIEDPDVLNRDWLHKPVTVSLDVIQVGQSRPSYVLSSIDNLKEHD